MTAQFQPNRSLNDRFLAAALFDERTHEGLDEGQLRRLAPSIFAETKHESRSERFQVIPTWEAIQALMKEGFIPVAAAPGRHPHPGQGRLHQAHRALPPPLAGRGQFRDAARDRPAQRR